MKLSGEEHARANTFVHPGEQNKTLLKGFYSVRLGRLVWKPGLVAGLASSVGR